MPKPKTIIFSGNPLLPDLIKEKLPDADISVHPPARSDDMNGEALLCLAEAEILYGFHSAPKNILSTCPKLKWVQYEAAGVDKILKALSEVPQEVKANISITRDGESFIRPVSQYVIGQILAISNQQYHWYEQQKKSVYQRDGSCRKPTSSSSAAILGLGCIGTEEENAYKSPKEDVYSIDLKPLQVWAMTRNKVPDDRKSPYVDEYRITSGLPELLSECDYIVNILPSTEETRGLLSGDVFSHCKNKKPVFINVGRGDVTDEDSLLKALRSGWLQHAVLDVHNPEPLPADSPLWREHGVVLTPHVAWDFNHHRDFIEVRADTFVKQYRRYVNKEALLYVVDTDIGY